MLIAIQSSIADAAGLVKILALCLNTSRVKITECLRDESELLEKCTVTISCRYVIAFFTRNNINLPSNLEKAQQGIMRMITRF